MYRYRVFSGRSPIPNAFFDSEDSDLTAGDVLWALDFDYLGPSTGPVGLGGSDEYRFRDPVTHYTDTYYRVNVRRYTLCARVPCMVLL